MYAQSEFSEQPEFNQKNDHSLAQGELEFQLVQCFWKLLQFRN